MSIHWQTGEPPEGKILAEYRMRGLAKVYQDVIHNARHCEVEILRWSTLDAAPDVLGRLEAYIDAHQDDSVELTKMDGLYCVAREDSSGSISKHVYRSAPSLASAIAELCGGTDGP